MRPMICQQCRTEMDPLKAIVEWMATPHYISRCDTIRLVHQHCMFIHTMPNTLEKMKMFDHWLPFWQLADFMEIPIEMQWDDKPTAISIFRDYINHQQKRAREVQNHANNNT